MLINTTRERAELRIPSFFRSRKAFCGTKVGNADHVFPLHMLMGLVDTVPCKSWSKRFNDYRLKTRNFVLH